MKKFTANTFEQANSPHMEHWLVPKHALDALIGKSCQTIEMMGLPQKQEDAVKDSLRQEIYKCFSWDGGSLYIDSELAYAIHSVEDQCRQYATQKGILVGGGKYKIELEVED